MMEMKEALAALPDEDAAKALEESVKDTDLTQLQELGAIDALVKHTLSKDTSEAVQTSLADCLRAISQQGSNSASVVANSFFKHHDDLAATKSGALLFFDVLDFAFRIRAFKRQFATAEDVWKTLLKHENDDVVIKTCKTLETCAGTEGPAAAMLDKGVVKALQKLDGRRKCEAEAAKTLQALTEHAGQHEAWLEEDGFLKMAHAALLGERATTADLLTALQAIVDSSTETALKLLRSEMLGKIIRLIGKAPFIHTRKLSHVLHALSKLASRDEAREDVITLVVDVLPGIFTNFSVANPAHAESQQEFARALVEVTATDAGCRAILKGEHLRRMLPLLESNPAIKSPLAQVVCNLVTAGAALGIDTSPAVPSITRLVTQTDDDEMALRAACALSTSSRGMLEENLLSTVLEQLTKALKAEQAAVPRYRVVESVADLCYADAVKEMVKSGVILAHVFAKFKAGESRAFDAAAARLLSQLSFACNLKSDLKRDFFPEIEALMDLDYADDDKLYTSLFPAAMQLHKTKQEEPTTSQDHAVLIASNEGEAMQQSVEAIAAAHDTVLKTLMPKNRPVPKAVADQVAAASVVFVVIAKDTAHSLPCRAYIETAVWLKKPIAALQHVAPPHAPWVKAIVAHRPRIDVSGGPDTATDAIVKQMKTPTPASAPAQSGEGADGQHGVGPLQHTNVNVKALVQESLNTFVAHLKSHQNKLETRFTAVDDRLARLEQKMAYMEGTVQTGFKMLLEEGDEEEEDEASDHDRGGDDTKTSK